jgi:hypothetical protein
VSTSAGELVSSAVESIARSLARKHNLVCDDGSIICWECGKREALLPQLHCGICLDITRRRMGHYDSQVLNRAQTPEDCAMLRK